VAPGAITRADQAEAVRLLRSAQDSFEARRFLEVLRLTEELTARFPASDVSGDALLLGARAELELGSNDRADELAERYLALLPPGDPRAPSVRMFQVEAVAGDPARELDRLLRLDSAATGEQIALAEPLARAAADSLSPDELEAVLTGVPEPGVLAHIVWARHAVTLLERGDTTGASVAASAAIEGGASERELELAEGVLRGELPPERRRLTTFSIATVLPVGGPPGLAEFARLVGEGVEVAAATVLGEPYEVTVVPFDDLGDVATGASYVSQLEAEGVAGVVGFLEDEGLIAAGLARRQALPIVSPTARTAATAGEGVYSLEGPDPQAAQTLARYAASRALQRVAIVLPQTPAALEEADAFQAEATRLGVPIVGRFTYLPQATSFESQIIGAQNALRATEIAALGLGPEDTLRVEVLEPVGVFLPIPPEDVEFIAPQIAHFALDTLAIELLGTSGWTDPQVVAALDPIYLEDVVATATVGTGPNAPGALRFREAYEAYFQRTLVSATPAIGYDATLLLLEALRAGRLAPAEVRASFQELGEVEGATGVFSVTNDRVVRRTELVRIDNRRLVPIAY